MLHARSELFDDLRRPIRGTVIHHHNLQLLRRQPLLQHAPHRLLDVLLVIVGINQRRNEWRHGLSSGRGLNRAANPANLPATPFSAMACYKTCEAASNALVTSPPNPNRT